MPDRSRAGDPSGSASPPRGDSLLRRLGRGTVQAFRTAEDIRALTESAEAVRRPITTGRRIAVIGMQGGAGKSTVAALLAAVFAHHRHDRVLALDLDPGIGSLPLLLGLGPASPARTLDDLADADVTGGSFDDVRPHLHAAGERLWTIPANGPLAPGGGLTGSAFQSVALPLTRFFGITIMDCGSGVDDDLTQAALRAAHALVLVSPATSEGARGAGRSLDRLVPAGLGHLVERTVVVFTVKSPHLRKALDFAGAAKILDDVGAAAVRLAYDRHIAAGTTLDTRLLTQTTRTTMVTVAAEALARATAQ
ncbi:MinD/ParA family ATP-binding protein [Spirillospora sp. CA-255316]